MITRRRLVFGSGGLLAAALLPAVEGLCDGTPQHLDKTLEEIRKRYDLPGIGAVVVSRNQITASGVCGFRKMGEEGAIPASAHWQLGSITKTFTATLAAILVERRKLTWDTPVRQIYPEHVTQMAPNVAGITIRQLVTHRSGMGQDVVPWEGVPETNQPGLTLSERRQKAAARALKTQLQFAPGAKSQYSNQGYNLLGAALEKVAGRPWEELIRDEIAGPLGIKSMVFGEPALGDPQHEPWPHIREGERWKSVDAVPLEMYGYHLCNPAGGISLTLAEVARWVQAHLNDGQRPGKQGSGILSKESLKTIHTAEKDGGVPAFHVGSQMPVLGTSLRHGGSNGRNLADLMILPERGVGIFVAVNAVPPDNIPAHWMLWNTLLASALPGKWPRPALQPPKPNAAGTVEGEALEVVRLTGGSVDFQNFNELSQKFQLWWSGAKDGNELVLRLHVPRQGRYSVEGIFARNADFGEATIKFGDIEKRLTFKTDRLNWERIGLGETKLAAGPQELHVTAHGSAGQQGVVCHLGLDVLENWKPLSR